MKLLLTSEGLHNDSIARALFDLAERPASELSIAVIPTAANVGNENKSWLIDILKNIQKQNFKAIDLVDISALPKEVWLPRLEAADILFFCGGNTAYLMDQITKSGLKDILPALLTTRIYSGNSAGAMVTAPNLYLNQSDIDVYYDEEKKYFEDDHALHLVDLYVRPHYNSPIFSKARKEVMEEIAKDADYPIYALDDESALKIDGDHIDIITEGTVEIFNQPASATKPSA